MALDDQSVILARRMADVAKRPPVVDKHAEGLKIDADRHRQLSTPKADHEALTAKRRAAGFTVVQNGRWYELTDPDGNKVGKGQKSEAAAWAIED